jgi:hypothetical protein
MRNLSVFCALLVAVSLTSFCQASINTGDLVRLDDALGSNSGGAFLATDLTAPIASPFLTFCLEQNEFFNPGTTYYVTVESVALFGGDGLLDIGGKGTAGTVGPPRNDPISPMTAWLYSNALAGNLAGYGYSNSDAGNTALQYAIWHIENEEDAAPTGLAATLYSAAFANAGSDIGNVRVMNVWESQATAYTEAGKKQSMLVLVPEVSTIAVWSVLSLLGAGVAYRRNAKQLG